VTDIARRRILLLLSTFDVRLSELVRPILNQSCQSNATLSKPGRCAGLFMVKGVESPSCIRPTLDSLRLRIYRSNHPPRGRSRRI